MKKISSRISSRKSKFGYFQQATVQTELIVDYKIAGIKVNGKSPTLQVLTAAGKFNQKYTNALQEKFIGRGDEPDILGQIAEFDVENYPQFVIKGWFDVIDEEGLEVPFTLEDCIDFVASLPEQEMDKLRAYCSNHVNFVETVDIKVVAKK